MRVLLITLFLVPCLSQAALPPKKKTSEIMKVLSAPHKIAVSEAFKMGARGYKKLYKLSFDSEQPMNVRWKAFMVMTSMGGKKSIPEIEKALKDDLWYMRSAGLVALQKIDRSLAVQWAKKLFSRDPALMVRLKATELLVSVPGNGTKDLFWKKLYTKDNFHKERSLWIRDKIATHLASNPRNSDYSLWKKALKDSDNKVRAQAVKALDIITKRARKNRKEADVSFWKSEHTKSL